MNGSRDVWMREDGSLPSRATITLATVSGMLVPAARSVIPMTVSGIPSVSPEQNRAEHLHS